MKYIAKSDTWLKNEPVQASTLLNSQKILVKEGESYEVKRLIFTDGLHGLVQLDNGAGAMWLFLPHWNTSHKRITAYFSLKQKRTSSLIYGELIFKEGNNVILQATATSGQAGYQYKGAETIRSKGCLPSGNNWKINTNGYYLSSSGIAGMFYHITPDPHKETGRGEFGLHLDANKSYAPGSAGCIVISNKEKFNQIRQLIDSIRNKQSFIPLTVKY